MTDTIFGAVNAPQMVFGAVNAASEMVFGAVNTVGDAPPSTPTQPSPPTVTATPASGQITVRWTPTSDGGSPIRQWLVRVYPVGDPPSPTPTQFAANVSQGAFTGLTNGTVYVVEVAAVNDFGTSAFGTTSATPAIPDAPPGAVTGLNLIPLDSAIGVTFNAPASLGTGTLVEYQVSVTTSAETLVYHMVGTQATLLAVSNDVQATVTVTVITTVGVSPPASGFVTPVLRPAGTTPPGSPTGLVATPYAGAVGLVWVPPASFGTYGLSDYLIRLSVAGEGDADRWYSTASPFINAGGLTNDIEWTVTVWARTGAGPSLTPATTLVTPLSTGTPAPAPIDGVGAPPMSPSPGLNPLLPDDFAPGIPDTPVDPSPPPVLHVDPPNIFAFYPVGVNGSQGVFSPGNWAGL